MQNISFATTSNDKHCQEYEEITLFLVEEVHWEVQCHFSHKEEASLLAHRLREDLDHLQVHWQQLQETSVPAIRRSQYPPKSWKMMHHAILQKCHNNPQGFPISTKHMLATHYEPSMLLKYPMKCTSSAGSSDILALCQSTQDQWGVHSPLVSGRLVFHWNVLIWTTALSLKALQSVLFSVPCSVELLFHQFAQHALICSRRIQCRCTTDFQLQYHY